MTLIKIDRIDSQDRVDSRLIAQELDIQHKNFYATIKDNQAEIESAFGILLFKTEEIDGRGQPSKYCYLTEDQATFLMTLSRNTKRVKELKIKLVKAFSDSKKVIHNQKEHILALKLELELVKAKQNLLQKRQDIVTMLPEPLQQKVLGYQEIKTVEYRDRIIKEDEIIRDGTTLNKTELCKRYGFLTAKGKPNYTQLNKWLQQFNLPSDAWKLTASIRENQELHSDYLPQLDELWRNGGRQMFFNEDYG